MYPVRKHCISIILLVVSTEKLGCYRGPNILDKSSKGLDVNEALGELEELNHGSYSMGCKGQSDVS